MRVSRINWCAFCIDINSATCLKRDVAVFAASSDPQDRAEQAKSGWGRANLRVGYGLSIDNARRLAGSGRRASYSS